MKNSKQQGAVLIVGLLILLVVTILGVSGMDFSIKSERVSANTARIHQLYHDAENAIDYSITQSDWRNTAINKYLQYKETSTNPTWGVNEINADETDRVVKAQSIISGNQIQPRGWELGTVYLSALEVRSLATNLKTNTSQSHIQGFYFLAPGAQ